MTCATIRNELVAYRDGELPELDRERIAAHLHTCPVCSQEERQLARLDQLLTRLERITPSPDFATTFWRKLEQERPTETKENWLGHWWHEWLSGWRMAPALVAAASLLIFFGYVLSSRQPTTLTPSVSQDAPAQVAKGPAPIPAQPDRSRGEDEVSSGPEKFAQSGEMRETEAAAEPEAEFARPEDLPPPLLENPSFFVHYPMLQKMEELQNFEAILALPGDQETQNRG